LFDRSENEALPLLPCPKLEELEYPTGFRGEKSRTFDFSDLLCTVGHTVIPMVNKVANVGPMIVSLLFRSRFLL
jgi:hypothetical protein